MLAAAHLDNWLFLVFVGIALFFQLVSRLASGAKRSEDGDDAEQRSTPPPVSTRRSPIHDSDSDQIRKFLEALGQPTTTPPPAPITPRSNVPPRPVAPVQPPRVLPTQVLTKTIRQPETETGEWRPKEEQAQTVARAGKAYAPRISTKPTSPPPLPLPDDTSARASRITTAPATTKPDIAELLRSP